MGVVPAEAAKARLDEDLLAFDVDPAFQHDDGLALPDPIVEHQFPQHFVRRALVDTFKMGDGAKPAIGRAVPVLQLEQPGQPPRRRIQPAAEVRVGVRLVDRGRTVGDRHDIGRRALEDERPVAGCGGAGIGDARGRHGGGERQEASGRTAEAEGDARAHCGSLPAGRHDPSPPSSDATAP